MVGFFNTEKTKRCLTRLAGKKEIAHVINKRNNAITNLSYFKNQRHTINMIMQ